MPHEKLLFYTGIPQKFNLYENLVNISYINSTFSWVKMIFGVFTVRCMCLYCHAQSTDNILINS
ncbi:hypothetical protein NEPAR06_0002 [Nematocida parisii]|uniref:Uncharacterized protein n=1 Tax=Nematocida parisii (strain ERTm3) TaxID=935791 RepID=I3EDY8_NEMP3|nr:uncharacterized protein NEPG_00037 [Nematocida parisii ERTm1]EIJ87435.1 hypothetical protein NEQG_02316 [Nematocida parisii ERTm3]KAI5127051.1 hypothetical protein NEPAR08_0723 [Nematocida parisii]EIJ94515.1 hypothetical protein NEPG_00037 [Nematocida parisii ERTm1]KAI5127603.1 hypothetical protein NEPAR03_0993 [Nematocida parisii]KAI5141150.1 hypothetical protein NEPAR04_0721 [Nematocida parisii]|eukprot:XP_013057871.1 hypothetical protein NEPG_00037 [Nematocida parisii ERTm1]